MNRKKTSVRYLNVKYNVNPDKKVVTCVLNFGINLNTFPYASMLLHNDRIFDLFNKEFSIDMYTDENGDMNPYVTSQIIAFANCSQDDEFDEEFGKKVSLTRAQEGAFDTAAYIYDKIQNELLNIANIFDTRAENCIESISKCNEHVNYLINEKYGEVNS